jgi:hypothetical protein
VTVNPIDSNNPLGEESHKELLRWIIDWIAAHPGGGSGVTIRKAGVDAGTQAAINLIEGANITITATNDPGNGEVDITITSTGGSGSGGMGPPGMPGADGDDGSDSWIPGPQGSKGDQGTAGTPGTPGTPGAAGAPGPMGPWGADGEDGIDFIVPGPTGKDGAAGTPGTPGAAGAVGPAGAPGPWGADGEDGVDFIMPGPVGAKGDQGTAGTPGAAGAAGPAGPMGMPGADADDPDVWMIPGPVGAKGDTGAGGGGGSSGTGNLDFGAFPGSNVAYLDVATVGVISTSKIDAWLRPVATADHTDVDHVAAPMKVIAEYVSDGNIRIYGINQNDVVPPLEAEVFVTRQGDLPVTGIRQPSPMFVGVFSVQWTWS